MDLTMRVGGRKLMVELGIGVFKSSFNKAAGLLTYVFPKSASLRRFAAVLLITALLTPLLLLNSGRTVSAQQTHSLLAEQAPAGIAPPQPFVIGATTNSSLYPDLTFALASSIISIGSFFSGPQLPPEFSSAKVPSTSATLLASANSFLVFFLPAKPVTSAPEPMPFTSQPAALVFFDFDGDGKTDVSRWKSSSQEWRIKNSTGGSVSNLTIGSSSSLIVPGDYDGDHITDRAVFNSGSWSVKQSSNGSTATTSWGTTGDIPVPADYDGDGKTDYAIYRPSTHAWWITYSGGATATANTLGSSGDIPVPGDYDGDGKADLAVFHPSTGTWYVTGSAAGSLSYNWGLSTDVPVPADYDGDGTTDYAIFRPSTGAWWVNKSTGSYSVDSWGNYEDQPVPGDYDGDGKADKAIWRPSTGVWYILKSSDSTYQYESMGDLGDIPAPSAFLKKTGAAAPSNDVANARLAPKNATGEPIFIHRILAGERRL
jgi:hypothetical protein